MLRHDRPVLGPSRNHLPHPRSLRVQTPKDILGGRQAHCPTRKLLQLFLPNLLCAKDPSSLRTQDRCYLWPSLNWKQEGIMHLHHTTSQPSQQPLERYQPMACSQTILDRTDVFLCSRIRLIFMTLDRNHMASGHSVFRMNRSQRQHPTFGSTPS